VPLHENDAIATRPGFLEVSSIRAPGRLPGNNTKAFPDERGGVLGSASIERQKDHVRSLADEKRG